MSKILILVDWYRPAYKAGGPIKSIFNVCQLLNGPNEVKVITGSRDLGDQTDLKGINLNQWHDRPEAKVMYIRRNIWNIYRLIRLLHKERPDSIYINGIFSWFFTLIPLIYLRLTNYQGALVIAPRGMLHSSAVALKKWKKNLYLLLFKKLIHNQYKFQATDIQEKMDLEKRLDISADQITIIGNLPGPVMSPVPYIEKSGRLKLVLISRLAVKKNIHILLEELRLVNYELVLDLYGDFESTKYRKTCQKLIDQLPSHVEVNYNGLLDPVKVQATLLHYDYFVLLTSGENFGHSIYESLSVGLPVIISQYTPWTSVQQKNAGYIWRNHGDLKNIIEKIAKMDQTTYEQQRRSAWQMAKSYLESEDYLEKYSSLFKRA